MPNIASFSTGSFNSKTRLTPTNNDYHPITQRSYIIKLKMS